MNKVKKKIAGFLFFILTFTLITTALASCNSNSLYSEGNGDLNVVCTSFPPFDFARQIGGDKITLTILQDNGADLHNYSPTTKTIAAMSNADIFICVGGDSDNLWIDDAIESSQNPDLKVLHLVDGIELLHAELEGHNHEGEVQSNKQTHSEDEHAHSGDEHVWLSLKNAGVIADKINAAFAEKDSKNAAYYQTQTDSFKAKISALDAEYAKAVSDAKTKTLVIADRFPFIYLVNDYGLCYYAAFSGCSTEINADFATQVKLIDAVNEHSLPAVIVTEGDNKELADNICEQTGCKKTALNSMQSITRTEIQNGVTYIDIMTENLASLKVALGTE